MSLGAGALEVSGGLNANSREEVHVSRATLKVGPPLKQPATDKVTLNKYP